MISWLIGGFLVALCRNWDSRLGAEDLGIPKNPQFNSSDSEGWGYFQVNQRSGIRLSSYRAFLSDVAKTRPNLTIISGAQTRKIIMKDGAVTGVEYAAAADSNGDLTGSTAVVKAKDSVILSAGSVGSPHLMQVSGIGDPAMLRSKGVTPAVALPGVGANLHDHLQIRTVFELKPGTTSLNQIANSLLGKLQMGAEYVFNQSGPLSMAPSQLGIFAKSSPEVATPDLQVRICALLCSAHMASKETPCVLSKGARKS